MAPLPLGAPAGPFKITGNYETRPFSYLYAATGPDGPAVLEEFVPPGAVRGYDGKLKPKDARSAPLYTDKLNRFKKASTAMKAVAHPNVVPLLGSFKHGDTSFRVFPWIRRRTLAAYLQMLPEHALRPDLALGLVEPLLNALEAGHALGMVHHAVNPYTVWMTEAGELLLSSFGDVYLEIREGYSAPELYSSVRGAVGPRTDLYSLAATALRALTASHPPSAARRKEITGAGGPDPMALPLSQLRGVLGKGLYEALTKSLRLDWEDRLQSVEEFRNVIYGRAPKPATEPASYPEPSARAAYPASPAPVSYPDPSTPPPAAPFADPYATPPAAAPNSDPY
ncbi:MAG: hypothetical protein LBQ12_12740, partial [Deltaproteobacteria bacterium]|nr:hypothetical protein [Deltaproteobacteria bacterium]